MSISEYLEKRNVNIVEGYSQEVPEQINTLIEITKTPNINVMEIGFNAGHSADIFLGNNNLLNLTSFDLGHHNYVSIGKEYIDKTYPNRHTLILGDSKITLPKFIDENKNTKFDVIFIDGGHYYDIVKSDLENSFYLSHADTIIIMDDTMYSTGWKDGWEWKQYWNEGPTQIWNEYVYQNKIIEMYRKDYKAGRGMSWGKFIF